MAHPADQAPPLEVPQLESVLRSALEPELGPVSVVELRRLTGGASRETWSFDAVDGAGEIHRLVLRRDPPDRPSPRGSMGREARCIRVASGAGLRVPRVLVDSDDPSVLGAAGMIMVRVDGETLPRRILSEDRFAAARTRLAADCGRFLAGLHRIDPDEVAGLSADDPLEQLRSTLDELGEPSPTFELVLRWLDEHRPPPSRSPALVHGDFRLGNLIVDETGLVAVLDWELAHRGDPIEDLGWLCVKAWRFGEAAAVGGFGTRTDLLDAYRSAGGIDVEAEVLHWWEVLNTLKWGVICMVQASVHLSGLMRSVELAAIGRRVCEQELDLLLLLADDVVDALVAERGADEPAPAGPVGDLHGRPSAQELLDAVRTFLHDEVVDGTTGRISYHARVAANVLGIVERELAAGSDQQARRAEVLAALGVDSEAALAAAIRSGAVDIDDRRLLSAVASGVVSRVEVANPRYLRLR